MRYVYILALPGFLAQPSSAQTTYATQDTAYIQTVEKAFAYLKRSDCKACLIQYQHAFSISQKSALSMLRAAVCAWQCQQKEQADTYLRKATSIDWWICEDVWENKKEYPELEVLRISALSADFQRYIDAKKIAEGRNPDLERELKEIFKTDQQTRLRLDTIGRQFGYNSSQAKPILEEMTWADSLNLLKIETILQQYGYPGKHLVGEGQAATAWLVIQHSSLTIQEKYLPLIQKAADQGELDKQSLALLVDRIRVYKGQKQLYGSQVKYGVDGKPGSFFSIEDEVNVNKRRAEAGMQPLEEYARYYGIDYVLPKK